MITKNAIDTTRVLASRLASKRLAVVAVENSPVEVLTNGTTVIVDETGATVNAAATAEVSSKVGILPSTHNTEYDNLVEQGKKAVAEVMRVARNLVAPIHEELIRDSLAMLETETISPENGFEVVKDIINPVLRDGNFLSFIEDYKEAKMAPVTQILRFGDHTADEVVAMLRTGFKATDEAIDMWVGMKGPAWFKQVWEDIFHNTLNSNSGTVDSKLSADRDVACAAFLIARYLFDNVPENIEMTLSAYQDLVSSIRNQSGFILYNQLVNLDRALKAGLMVYKVAGKKVYVFGDVYDKWIEDGGDVDILFGMVVTGRTDMSITEINNNARRYHEAWLNHNNRQKAAETQNRFNKLRNILLLNFQKQLERDAADAGAENTIAEIYNKFKRELMLVTDSQLQGEQLNETVLKLLCTTRFNDPAVYFVLTRIEFHCKSNPALSAREAASIAIIEYVTDWVFSQLRTVTV